MWSSLARLNMFRSLQRSRNFKHLQSVYHLCSIFTLADKMSADNVVQLCGTDVKAVQRAVQLIKKGEIIALPTDTVYGLACDSFNSSAVERMYEIKGRDRNKPFAICVSEVSEIKKWGDTKELPKGLLRKLLPGPVTVLLNRKERLNPALNPGVKKVGIRVPDTLWFPFIQFVSGTVGNPLALTSANLSNEPNCICAEEFKSIWPNLGGVFDVSVNMVDYELRSREPSTIVDLSECGKFRITRPGVAYNQTLEILRKYDLEELP